MGSLELQNTGAPKAAPVGPAAEGPAPDLRFSVLDAGPVAHSAVPAIEFVVSVDAGPAAVQSIQLRTQVRIAVARRPYDAQTQERLGELFGEASAWANTARSFLWADTSVSVPAFTGSTTIRVPIPCSYDMEVMATKYLHGIREGNIPVELLFSGSVFYDSGAGLRVRQISWDSEAYHPLPARAWHDVMDRYFPGSAWLRLPAETFDRLREFRTQNSHLTWESTVDHLLRCAQGGGETGD